MDFSNITPPRDDNKPMVAGQPGTLLEHGTEVREGRTYRVWKTGPIKGREEYSVGQRGELRHTHPHFRGKKKHRLAFRKKLIAALNTTTPVGYYELQPTDKLKPLDVIIDVRSGKWSVTPYIGLTVAQMRANFLVWPRAARMTPGGAAETAMVEARQELSEIDDRITAEDAKAA
jgi:hypothetical protein